MWKEKIQCSNCCFNTTFVTVYRKLHWVLRSAVIVSIQPLLLFILHHWSDWLNGLLRFNTTFVTVYQSVTYETDYIEDSFNTTFVTVYLLLDLPDFTSLPVSIQPLLLFIWYAILHNSRKYSVSIQPLLLFIQKSLQPVFWQRGFNTTFVTVYRVMIGMSAAMVGRFNTTFVTVYRWSRTRF